MLATVIVLYNLAGVAVQFFYQFIGDLTGSDYVSALWENPLINVITCLCFLAIATAVAYRGITTTERVQFVLVGFQMVILVLFAVIALAKAGSADTGVPFSLDWFRPAGLTMSAFIAGLSGSIFAFWGWDTRPHGQRGIQRLRQDPRPGRAAVRPVDPADLPAGRRRDPDVRRRSARRGSVWEMRRSPTTSSAPSPNP